MAGRIGSPPARSKKTYEELKKTQEALDSLHASALCEDGEGQMECVVWGPDGLIEHYQNLWAYVGDLREEIKRLKGSAGSVGGQGGEGVAACTAAAASSVIAEAAADFFFAQDSSQAVVAKTHEAVPPEAFKLDSKGPVLGAANLLSLDYARSARRGIGLLAVGDASGAVAVLSCGEGGGAADMRALASAHTSAPVLCLRWSPHGALLAAGTMDGKVFIFALRGGREGDEGKKGYELALVAQRAEHSATWVNALAWSPDGRRGRRMLCSAGRDKTVRVYKVGTRRGGWKDGDDAEDLREGDVSASGDTFFFKSAVQAVEFDPLAVEASGRGSVTSRRLVVGASEDNFLHFIDFSSRAASSGKGGRVSKEAAEEEEDEDEGEGEDETTWTHSKSNLNANGDGVVSFSVLALRASPSGRFLVASTDKGTHLVTKLPVPGSAPAILPPLRQLDFAGNEYSCPRAAWGPDEKYVYATNDRHEVEAFSLARGGGALHSVRAHSGKVKSLVGTGGDGGADGFALFSCAFDRTIQRWSTS